MIILVPDRAKATVTIFDPAACQQADHRSNYTGR
jgi:hypothetical protein